MQVVQILPRGSICFDEGQITLENVPDDILAKIEPYLQQELEYKTATWVDGKKIREVHRAAPGTPEHFSVLVWFYLPHKAGVKTVMCGC